MDEVKPLSLAVAMGLTLDVAGTLYVYGLADSENVIREVISATILLVVALLWLLLPCDENEPARARAPVWLALLPMVAGMISMSDIMSHVASGWTVFRAVLFGGSSLLLFGLAARRAPASAIALVSLVLGVVLRYINTRHIPIDPARGDMLPLVQGALTNLLAGHSPYTTYHMPWAVPLTYLPVTWLAYAPMYVLGLDIRWTNVIAEVVILGATIYAGRGSAGRGRNAVAEQGILLWAWLFLSPSIVHWDLITTAPIGWAALAWTLALIIRSRHRAAAIALGVSAATTPFIAVFAPFIALCWWRQLGFAGAARRLVEAGAIAAALILPWFIWTPGAFLDGAVRWFNDLDRFPRQKWIEQKTWDEITGYSGLFWIWKIEGWLKPIQLTLVGLVCAVYAARGGRLVDLGRHATAAFTLFMLFNPVLWPYLYNPALVTTLLTIVGAGMREPAPAGARPVAVPGGIAARAAKKYPRPTAH